MSHSETCPICHGTGKVADKRYQECTGGPSEKICHGCNGSGWVTVSDW